jgi:aspartate aminotransferase
MVRIAGGRSVFVDCPETQGFRMTAAQFEAALTPRTKLLIMNSPSNPTGMVYEEGELRAIAEVAVRRGIHVLSDEIYEKLVYDGARHVSIASLSPEIFGLTVTVNGFSKAHSMTGWRLGYAAGPKPIMDAVSALQSHAASGPNTFAQFGALEALRSGAEDVRRMVDAFAERRNYLCGRLCAIRGVTCVRPKGAFYVLPNIGAFGLGSVPFAERLLEAEGVAVVPGVSFGSDRHVRLSYACGIDELREGVDRFERFVANL